MTLLDALDNRKTTNEEYILCDWVDAILKFKKHNPQNRNWKVTVFIFITWMLSLNWWVVSMILEYFNLFKIPLTTLNIFPGNSLDDFFSYVLQFALPFGILNYFLIFHNNRYEGLIKKYGPQKRNYAFIYIAVSTLGAFLVAIIYGILSGTIFN